MRLFDACLISIVQTQIVLKSEFRLSPNKCARRHTTAFAERIPMHTRSSNSNSDSTTHTSKSRKISLFDSYHDSFNRVRFLQTLQFYLCERNGAILASHWKFIFTEHSCVSPRPRLRTPEYNSNHMKWDCVIWAKMQSNGEARNGFDGNVHFHTTFFASTSPKKVA